MPFNFILNEYPNEVIIGEDVYPINTDFKRILGIVQLLNDDLFSNEEKVKVSLGLFYKTSIPKNTGEGYSELLHFINMYKEEKEGNSSSKKEPRVIDYEIDSGAIYTAFIEKYQIDLQEVTMHWFKFSTLLENLSTEKPRILQLIEIRGMEIDDKLSPKEKSRLRKLKNEYSLEEKEDIMNGFADAFLFGAKGGVSNG